MLDQDIELDNKNFEFRISNDDHVAIADTRSDFIEYEKVEKVFDKPSNSQRKVSIFPVFI